MDSFSTHKVKTRKMKVVVHKSRVQILYDLFCRAIEITVVVVTVAKLCYQLVIMFEDSGLTHFILNRHLAFLLGNAIVITIVTKCGFFASQEPDARRKKNDFYDEFVHKSSRGEHSLQRDASCGEKEIMLENKKSTGGKQIMSKEDVDVNRQIIQEITKKSYERSRSESSKKSASCGRSKRPETETIDSDDELRYKIESFIARQRRNQKDEEFCIT